MTEWTALVAMNRDVWDDRKNRVPGTWIGHSHATSAINPRSPFGMVLVRHHAAIRVIFAANFTA